MRNYKRTLFLVCLFPFFAGMAAMQNFKWKAGRTCDEAIRCCVWGVKIAKEKVLWRLNIPTPYQLLDAASSGHITEIERLVSLGISVDAEEPYDFFKWFLGGDCGTPLAWAINCSQHNAAMVLIRLGARIDKVGERNITKKFRQRYIIEILQAECPEMQGSAVDVVKIIGAYVGNG